MEAVATVFPALLTQMRTAVVENLAKHPRPDYQTRLAISRFLGMDVDGSTASIRANQSTFAAPLTKPSEQTPAGPAGPRAGAAHLTLGDRTTSAANRASMRD